ncbi:Ferredoxin [Streptacidiphilus jiangxiensis]|uniref:Ferredoxin n=1 Tax=Streptacidiphilus jiangxiensis TaxID=235985 RepID=A0A1H7P244_STRJI|nr:ferredoxin [Streptacidiphilus jiangxiensis]SEL29388.1 Ferredoxin [Streptacidiphilus jiangxiensis]
MRVSVDPGRCCSSGQCVTAVPEVFDQSEDDGVVLLIQPEPPADLRSAVRTAAAICPGRAITVHEP